MYSFFKNSFGYIMPLTVIFILILAIVLDAIELYSNYKHERQESITKIK